MHQRHSEENQMTDTTKEQSDEETSKDMYFGKIADLADEMISKHGKDFTMGAFVLAARFIAEGQPLSRTDEKKNH